MMLGVVASDGRQMPPVWFEKKKGKKGIDITLRSSCFQISQNYSYAIV